MGKLEVILSLEEARKHIGHIDIADEDLESLVEALEAICSNIVENSLKEDELNELLD